MNAGYDCVCGKPVDLEEELLVRQALIRRGEGCIPGESPEHCHDCVTAEPPIRFAREEYSCPA